jgi:hypothetical protein
MWYACERRENCIRLWWEIPWERDRSEDMRRRDDGIRMDLREIGWGVGVGVEWIRLAQDRVGGGLL